MFRKLLAGAGIAAAAVAALPASACAETAIGGLGCGVGSVGGGIGCGLGTGIIGGLGCGIGYGLGCVGFGLGISLPYWGMPWSWW
ncbi:MAG: hypothetical protein WBZ29_09875 [Methanocella sp.]